MKTADDINRREKTGKKDEVRRRELLDKSLDIIRSYDGPPVRIMEVCGTHTHEIFRQGIRDCIPRNVKLISGPGCPVCVTPSGYIDEAVFLAKEKGCVIATFGDLIRVPGSDMSLAGARALGADVVTVYSPLDALKLAEENPEKEVVFLSVGFETTTPSSVLTVRGAEERGIRNYSLLTANKTMDNAYRALKDSADAFLYPGHVSTITGTSVYKELLKEGISGAVAGFGGPEILTAIALILNKLKEGVPFFVNAYPRVVTDDGSPAARRTVDKFMEPADAEWRGIGVIPGSGLRLRDSYACYDARIRFNVPRMEGKANPACRCGDILRGGATPEECPLFGKVCTPDNPAGACMVSSEGTCAAYYKYRL